MEAAASDILALDLSTKSSGWSISQNGTLVDYGCITHNGRKPEERILHMRNEICKILDKYNVSTIILEDVPQIQNTNTQKMLTWLQGVVLTSIYEFDKKIEVVLYQSSSWRSKIGISIGRGIKREALKKADIQYVKNKYGIEANDDICDSICLLDAYLYDTTNDWSK